MKKILSLITALALIAMATPTFSAVGNGSEPETVPPEQEIAAPADSLEESEEVIPASLGEAESGIQPYAQSSKVEYSDSNIIGGSIYYDPASGTIVDCDTNVISCVIPSEIDGVKITTIGTRAFEKTDLIRVTIPESVTVIGDYAFSSSKLNGVSIPSSVISIGAYAFSGTPIKFATVLGVCTLSKYVFGGCDQLETVSIPSVTDLGAYAFSSCSALYNIQLPEGITAIPERAFYDCESLADIEIPLSVKKIGEGAFYGADLSGDFVIPNSVTSIGESAFSSANLQGHLIIPNSVVELGKSSFSSCSFGEVTIPGTIKNIPDSAFSDCDALAKINIGEGVVSIGKNAFYMVAGWKIEPCKVSVSLPSTLEYILDSAFFYGTTAVSTGGLYTVARPNNITDVYYGGCADKWQTVLIGSANDSINNAVLHTATHDYQYMYDDSEHWLACSFCGLVSGERSPHVMDGGKCTVCKYGAPEEHVHSFTYGTDVHVHWQICKDCGFTCNVEEHVFSGNVCAKCNYVKTESGLSGDMDNNGEITLDDAIEVLKMAMKVNS